MQAFRQRAVCAARRTKLSTPRNARSYASGGHHGDEGHGKEAHGKEAHHEEHHHDEHHHDDHHHAPPVNETLGPAFYAFATAVPLSYVGYSISRPGENGEPSSLSQWLSGFDRLSSTWEERNNIRTAFLEQASHDKHLFLNSGKSGHVELKAPELLYGGSQVSVPAGFYANLDHVTEHYRQKYVAEEERKAKKLLQKQEQAQAQEQAQT